MARKLCHFTDHFQTRNGILTGVPAHLIKTTISPGDPGKIKFKWYQKQKRGGTIPILQCRMQAGASKPKGLTKAH